MSDMEKKDFFNKLDKKYKGKDEAKVDELTKGQEKLPPALQKAIKAKEKNEDLDSKDKPPVKDVANQLKKAVKAHGQQSKDLEKAMKSEEESFDIEKLKEDMNSQLVLNHLQGSNNLSRILGINGTPAFVFGDQVVPGAIDLKSMRTLAGEIEKLK